MTSAAETPSSLWMSVGMPRPLSSTLTDPSGLSSISTRSQWPASASSIALSETSNTMWCRPDPSSVSPMYMPGRLRTASRPVRTLMESAAYSAGVCASSVMPACPAFSAHLIVPRARNVTRRAPDFASCEGDEHTHNDQKRARHDVDPPKRARRPQKPARLAKGKGGHEVAAKRNERGHQDDGRDVRAGDPRQVEEPRQHAHIEEDRLGVADHGRDPGREGRPPPRAC